MLSLVRLIASGLYGSELGVLNAQVVLYIDIEAFDAQGEIVFGVLVITCTAGRGKCGVLR